MIEISMNIATKYIIGSLIKNGGKAFNIYVINDVTYDI